MIPTSTAFQPSVAFLPLPAQCAFMPSNGQSRTSTHAQIAKCAYDIYIEHGRADGRSEQNWLQAEEELAHKALAAAHKSTVDRPV